MLNPGELVHIITRRRFEDDVKRHFVGAVEDVHPAGIARVQGYTFIFDPIRNQFIKRPHRRTRLIGLADAGNVVNILPDHVDLQQLEYSITDDHRLVLADGAGYELDISEFR